MSFFDDLQERSNRKKYKEQYDKAELLLTELNNLPRFKVPYEIRSMQPEEIHMNNEEAYEYMISIMAASMDIHKEIQDIRNYYFDRIKVLVGCVNESIAKKRLYDRLGLEEKFAESAVFLDSIQNITNKYYDKMISQYKVCESGAYGEYKVNEKLKAYAKEHGGIVLENIRLEVGIDKESAETDTLFLTDKAIYSIETKYFGAYEVKIDSENNWYSNKNDRWLSMNKSPSKQAIYHVRNLKDFFEEMKTDYANLPIIPIVVMANPKTKIKNEGTVKVYSISHLNEMIFNKNPVVMDVAKQMQIEKLIISQSLAGKPQRFFNYYNYLFEVREKIEQWFQYYNELFEIVLKIFQQCDYTKYIYEDKWKIVRGEKQLLGAKVCDELHNMYYQFLTLTKERITYDENFGKHYSELALQRK